MKKLFINIFFILFATQLFSQAVTKVDSIAGELVKAIRKDKTEKVIVQTNKWYYTAGEDMWLKAWVFNNVSNKFYSHSKNLYIDIVDERDTAVSQMLLNIPSEKTEGYIRLSDSIPEGHYWIRAYTSTMLKTNLNSIFVKPIYIVNPKYKSKLSIEKLNTLDTISTSGNPIISFFPEGGSVISGINTQFAIKAVNGKGKPIGVKGYIADNTDSSVITWFNTDTLSGLGKFNFYVGQHKTYIAHIQLANKTLYYTLPKIQHDGSQIAIKQESPLSYKVVISQGDSLYKKGVSSYLIGLSKDSICFIGVGKDMYELNIPKQYFPAGEAKLLLVNDQQKIVSERGIYIAKPDGNLKVITDKPIYSTREKVNVQLYVGDSVFHPMFSALSIAVTDDSIVKEPIYENGPIVALTDSNAALNDLIMLTSDPIYAGKFVHQINQNIPALINDHDEVEFETINGTILNRKKLPIPNRIVTLYTNKKISLFDTDTTNLEGKFNFKIPLHYDTIPFTIQVSNLKGNVVDDKIEVDLQSIFPSIATPKNLKNKITPQQTELVVKYRTLKLDSSLVRTGKEWLKDVIVKTTIKSKNYNTSKRVSNFSQIITGENLQKMTGSSASNAMLMIPGLHLRGGFLTLGGARSFTISAKDEPLLIVDGMMVAGGNGPGGGADSSFQIESSPVLAEISKIPTDIIDFVEVLKGPEAAFYGTRSSNGVIIINTHRVSNFRNHIENYGTVQYNSKSYHLAPNFTAPDYDDLFIKSSVLHDTRSTVYWNGHVYTNPNGKANISFYTSDSQTPYSIKITGVTVTGEWIEKTIKINRN